MSDVVITAKTAADATQFFYVAHGFPITITMTGASTDSVPIKRVLAGSAANTVVSLVDATPEATISAVGYYNIAKGVTTGTVAIYLSGGKGSIYDGVNRAGAKMLGLK